MDKDTFIFSFEEKCQRCNNNKNCICIYYNVTIRAISEIYVELFNSNTRINKCRKFDSKYFLQKFL